MIFLTPVPGDRVCKSSALPVEDVHRFTACLCFSLSSSLLINRAVASSARKSKKNATAQNTADDSERRLMGGRGTSCGHHFLSQQVRIYTIPCAPCQEELIAGKDDPRVHFGLLKYKSTFPRSWGGRASRNESLVASIHMLLFSYHELFLGSACQTALGRKRMSSGIPNVVQV